MNVRVFLSMKNAKAIGIYNLETRSICVLQGAKFERLMSKSFQNHNYRKLRDDLIGKKLLDDNYILLKDYEFNSLSSAAAVIGGRSAAGTIEWKL